MLIQKAARVALLLGLMHIYGILPVSAVPILSVAPSSQTVQPGQSFALDIGIADVIDLYAWQFDLAFDPTILAAGSVTEGPFLLTGGATSFLPGFIDNVAGTITFIADTLQTAIPGVSGSGILATVGFQALALGTSPVTLSNVLLLDSSSPVPAEIPFNTTDGSVTVAAIPEPNTFLLLGNGLLILLGYAYYRREHVA